MRVVVGSGSSTDFRQTEHDWHHELMSRFVAQPRDAGPSRCCTMILRSATSSPAQALIAMKDDLADAGLSAKAILATLAPEEDLRRLFASLSELAPTEPASELIRWARNPRLLDAHEQVTYGATMCWSGDAMRRDADKRNPLVLLDDNAPDAVRLGRQAFTALWAASVAVPERHLIARTPPRPSGAYERTPDTQLPPRPHSRGWPLVRH